MNECNSAEVIVILKIPDKGRSKGTALTNVPSKRPKKPPDQYYTPLERHSGGAKVQIQCNCV